MMRYAKEGIGEKIVDIVGSISKITKERYDDATMLANYGRIEPTLLTPQAIYDAVKEVKAEVKDMPGSEGLYINGVIDAFELHARILGGEEIPYKDAIKVMQQVELREVPQYQFDALAETICKELGDMGYTGNVGEKVTAWLRDTTIEADKVVDFSETLLHKAKARCEKSVTKMAEGDGIDAVYPIRGVFWSGLSRYLGNFRGDLTFNLDRPWSVPTFANILCHEGYPGHQAFYSHWDDMFKQGKLPLEGAFYSTAGNPADPMFEGSPECGLHFLGWDDFNEETPEITDEQKAIFRTGRNVLDLQRMLQQQACFMYYVKGASKEDITQFMMKDNIYNSVEVNNTIRFFTHPVQRYYYPAYYYGRWLVYGCYESVPKAKRGEFFRLLYDRPHTNETLVMETSELVGKKIDPLAER